MGKRHPELQPQPASVGPDGRHETRPRWQALTRRTIGRLPTAIGANL
jgi:hypothetical protein